MEEEEGDLPMIARFALGLMGKASDPEIVENIVARVALALEMGLRVEVTRGWKKCRICSQLGTRLDQIRLGHVRHGESRNGRRTRTIGKMEIDLR